MGGLIGAVIVFVLISRLSNRGNSRREGAELEISWRFIFLTLVFVLAFAHLADWFSALTRSVLVSVQIEWIGQALQFAAVVLVPFAILRFVPPWLAWRVCRPLELFWLGRFCYWFTPGAKARELEHFAALLDALRGIPPAPMPVVKIGTREKILRFLRLKKPPRPFVVDAGTVLALALAAEVRGDFGRATRLLHAFDYCPPGTRIPGMLRRFAFEELAWRAAQRGDWRSVLDRARRGCGRGAPLLKRLAEKHLTGTTNRPRLWLAWSICPARRKALPLILADVMRNMPSSPESLDASLRTTHLRLLRQAAEGVPVTMTEVFRLAQRWDAEFAPDGEEALLRRGLELGARDVLGIAAKIKENVLEELEEMAGIADGEIPAEIAGRPEDEKPSCATKLAVRLKNRLYDDVSRAQALFVLEKDAPVADEAILDLWERWLALREAVARLQSLLGPTELATLWYGGLREDAWNGASRLSNACGNRIAWISIIQFRWVVEIAELLGDEEAMTVNRNNMKLCGYRPPFSPRQSLLDISSRCRRLLDWPTKRQR